MEVAHISLNSGLGDITTVSINEIPSTGDFDHWPTHSPVLFTPSSSASIDRILKYILTKIINVKVIIFVCYAFIPYILNGSSCSYVDRGMEKDRIYFIPKEHTEMGEHQLLINHHHFN